MLHKTKVMWVVAAVIAIGVLSGCYKDRTIVSDTGEEITRPVSFTNDIIPIFNKSCNGSGCHSTGGISPDLSAANAFLSLSGGGYFNTTNPQNSDLYLWMTGKKGTPMPLSGSDKDYNALVLAWIKQGALNN
ncbi:MAG TPA: hypothetical protein PKA77_03265 [Chitinophagaceae bacterium]|jgi:hypothetical protein|nr:hypothetical protein [Chitinophagaceae bacterium]HMU58003.1 hypothetical protein [Chitinophagaceae bacterium]